MPPALAPFRRPSIFVQVDTPCAACSLQIGLLSG
jgi:hypothetical protein